MARTSLMDSMMASVLVVFLALLAVSEANLNIPTECPKEITSNSTVQIADDTDCTKYYLCIGNTKMSRECPVMDADGNRLYFNPELQVCDWPYNVHCKQIENQCLCNVGKITRKQPQPSLRVEKLAAILPVPTECPKHESKEYTVNLPNEYDCTKFYTCSFGKKIPQVCPLMENGERLWYNKIEQVCDWPFNVDCDLPLPKLMSLSSVRNVKYPTVCPKNDPKNESILLPDETDCTKYYMCGGGVRYRMVCAFSDKQGNRLYFNPKIHGCDWPFNANCEQIGNQCVCRNEEKTPKQVQSSVRVEKFAAILPVPTECPKHESKDYTVNLPDEYDCTKFYTCSFGEKIPRVCPLMENGKRLWYNKVEQVCDWPFNVDCDLPLPKLMSLSSVRNMNYPTECPKVDSKTETIVLPDETDCTKFYMCSAGVRIHKDCAIEDDEGNREYFNPILHVCDWSWNVDCSYGPSTPAHTTPSSTTPSSTTPEPTTPSTTTPKPTTPSSTTPSSTTPSSTTPSSTTPSPTTPSSTTPSSTTPSPVDPGVEGCIGTCPNDDPPNKITALPHEDCRKWCRCENRVVKVWICPANFYFSPTLKKCTDPNLSGCTGARDLQRSGAADKHDEAIMNVLGYKKRFLW